MVGNGHGQFRSRRKRSHSLPATQRVRLKGQHPQVPSYLRAASGAANILYP